MSNDIFMEPDEYEQYLQEQNELYEQYLQKQTELQEENANKNIGSTTLYELNQSIINGMPALSENEERKASLEFFDWISKLPDNPKFYMLLCSELNYYTVFHINDTATKEDFWNELYDIAKELGTLKAMEIDSGCFSIWADWPQDNISHLFYLFPYDRGVVEV